MAIQTINIGTSANDGTGDNLRNAFIKTEDNFNELYSNNSGPLPPSIIYTIASDFANYLNPYDSLRSIRVDSFQFKSPYIPLGTIRNYTRIYSPFSSCTFELIVMIEADQDSVISIFKNPTDTDPDNLTPDYTSTLTSTGAYTKHLISPNISCNVGEFIVICFKSTSSGTGDNLDIIRVICKVTPN